MIKSFSNIQFEHVPRAQNKHSDALATLPSKLNVSNEELDVKKTVKGTSQATLTNSICINPINEQDQRSSIIENLNQPSMTVVTKNLNFVVVDFALCHRGSRGVFTRTLSLLK